MPIGATVAAVVGGAAISGGAAIAGSAISANATKTASKAATTAANNNNALQKQIYDANTANLNPFLQTGTSANTAQADFLGLNGSQPQSTAFNNYLNSTGYNFTTSQGINAITSNRAASGLLNSGSTLKALDQFGQANAQTYGQNYLNNLGGLSGQGLTAGSAIAGVGQNYGSQVSANNNSAATNVGNAAIAGANSTNALLGQGVSSLLLNKGLSSFGSGAGSSTSGIGSGLTAGANALAA